MSLTTASVTQVREGSPIAALEFKVGAEELKGTLEQNATLQIIYDPARLPVPRRTRYGSPAWQISGTVCFHPGLETFTGAVVKNSVQTERGMHVATDPVPAPMTVVVPPDATKVRCTTGCLET
jgi:hypothetical protein